MAAHKDGEVLYLDKDGHIVQWNAESQCEYNSGETLEEFGEENLTPEERVRVGLNLKPSEGTTMYTKGQESSIEQLDGELLFVEILDPQGVYICAVHPSDADALLSHLNRL